MDQKGREGRYSRKHRLVPYRSNGLFTQVIETVPVPRRQGETRLLQKRGLVEVIREIQKEKTGKIEFELYFMDEMRYGLMSNYRRSWSKIGKRTEWKNQQEFENGYLYSAVNPISGKNFHLIGFEDSNSANTKTFLEKLKETSPNKHLLVVLDNAPFHKLKILREMNSITLIFLPSYSPQLNPTERFFGEVRKSTANRIFETLTDQEKEIEKKVVEYYDDVEAVRKLTGYEWILKQCEGVF